jgi:hypothetical protein
MQKIRFRHCGKDWGVRILRIPVIRASRQQLLLIIAGQRAREESSENSEAASPEVVCCEGLQARIGIGPISLATQAKST